jgi:hypothetical protein
VLYFQLIQHILLCRLRQWDKDGVVNLHGFTWSRQMLKSRKSKPFIIATEGATTDGRHISKEMLTQMAANYRPDVYTAVVNLEHFLSMHPESAFSAYGKVISLGTQEKEIFGQKRTQLTAVVEVTDAAVALQQAGKKCFASMEIMPNFTGRGEAYMTGLALTDTPASLGTEPMRFSAFSTGKKDDIYVFNGETELSFEGDEPKNEDEGAKLFTKVKELLGMNRKVDDARLLGFFTDHGHAIETLALSQKTLLDRQEAIFRERDASEAQAKEFKAALDKLTTDFNTLKTELSNAAATPQRPGALGGSGAVKTDC